MIDIILFLATVGATIYGMYLWTWSKLGAPVTEILKDVKEDRLETQKWVVDNTTILSEKMVQLEALEQRVGHVLNSIIKEKVQTE